MLGEERTRVDRKLGKRMLDKKICGLLMTFIQSHSKGCPPLLMHHYLEKTIWFMWGGFSKLIPFFLILFTKTQNNNFLKKIQYTQTLSLALALAPNWSKIKAISFDFFSAA